MKTDTLKTMRTALKAGKNLPLIVHMDNDFRVINESAIGHFTFWDDTNECLYELSFINPITDTSPRNNQSVSMFCVDYGTIQCMETAVLPLTDLDNIFDSMGSTGRVITDANRSRIKKFFNYALDPNRKSMNREEINEILGSELNTKDNYYSEDGHMTVNYKETLQHKELNKYVDEEIQKNNNNN